MDEKKMTLEELIGWLDGNDVPYGIDDAGRLTVKGDLNERFRDWVRTCKYTSLPGELVHVDGNLWLEQTSIVSLGGLTSVGGDLDPCSTSITSLGSLTFVGWFFLCGASITSLDDLPQVRDHIYLDESQCRLLTRGALQKVKGKIKHRDQATEKWVTLSPAELETIVAENERRESLHHTRGINVGWGLQER